MTKLIIPYLLILAGVLSACQADYIELSPDPAPDGSGEAITLSINSSDFVVTNGVPSRAADNRKFTEFEEGDRVGLIIFDDKNNVISENVPYVCYLGLDENNEEKLMWKVDDKVIADEGAGEYKRRVYFDGTLTKYIVYYPYHQAVDAIMHISDIEQFKTALKDLDEYQIREDQTQETDYRFSDPMMWTAPNEEYPTLTKDIDATLSHLRNSFCLDPKVKCVLYNGQEITYRPKSYILNDKFLPTNLKKDYKYETGFEELRLYEICQGDTVSLKIHDIDYPDKNMSIVYEAEDGSFRYIVREDTPMTFTWRYYYRGRTYAGTYDTTKEKGEGAPKEPGQGVRFLADESANIGKYSGSNLRVGDYFCKGDDNNGNIMGFPFPWEAVDVLDPEKCLGVIFHLGLTSPQNGAYNPITEPLSTYEDDLDGNDNHGNPLDGNPDHGYVIALTDAPAKDFPLTTIMQQHPWSSDRMKGVRINRNQYSEGEWSGYESCKRIGNYIKDDANQAKYPGLSWDDFPAFKMCKIYGSRHPAFQTPDNTSGWYLPSYRQLLTVFTQNTATRLITKRIAIVRGLLPGRIELNATDKHPYKNNVELWYYNGATYNSDKSTQIHWSSSEENLVAGIDIFNKARFVNLVSDKSENTEKNKIINVRAILTF